MGEKKDNEKRAARQSEKGVRSSKKSTAKAWTKEEMCEAEPIPLPTVDDDSDEKTDAKKDAKQ